ncbi:hypothetical protein [Actinoplanes sp. NPDC051851]|uniref:hypothetical protein n=1 Tax=Actinoplanes sp. NPDC051851 TaxID=3154753 RepID=UPI00342782E3
MTSISSLSSASTSSYYTQSLSRTKPKDDPLAKVAETLGLSTDQLKEQLQGGKTLNDVATDQGVSHDDLIASIESTLPSDAGSTAAEDIAAGRNTPPPPPPPGGPRGENACLQDDEKLTQISDLLNMDTKEVTDSATTASSLIGLLQNKGVDLSQLRNVLNQSGDLLDVTA